MPRIETGLAEHRERERELRKQSERLILHLFLSHLFSLLFSLALRAYRIKRINYN